MSNQSDPTPRAAFELMEVLLLAWPKALAAVAPPEVVEQRKADADWSLILAKLVRLEIDTIFDESLDERARSVLHELMKLMTATTVHVSPFGNDHTIDVRCPEKFSFADMKRQAEADAQRFDPSQPWRIDDA